MSAPGKTAGQSDLLKTIVIEHVSPELEGGRHPVKREVGETFEVWADIFAEGHDVLAAVLKYRPKQETAWRETPMRLVDDDRWRGSFPLERNTRYLYTIEAFRDAFETWRRNLGKKLEAEEEEEEVAALEGGPGREARPSGRQPQPGREARPSGRQPQPGREVASELLEGRRLLAAAAGRASGDDRALLEAALGQFGGPLDQETALTLAHDERLAQVMARYPDRSLATVYSRVLEVVVDRVAARFAAWYELFHRSQGTIPGRSATFKDCEARLAEVQAMGFDVIYLPPIHPIGRTGRKGRNNALVAGPNDPGSPWAIGNELGGHKAVDPALGTLEDFDHFVAAARARGMEVALDYALQCSPDHPYVQEHPDWFYRRPDGTIRYAENPPKKYQDIYPLNFSCDDWQALWQELKSILVFWIQHGVRTFRVDNPHTKPFTFWEWVIGEIQRDHPDVVFLAEAFTRPKLLKHLARAGFTQSYTYFTWRDFKAELTDYFVELGQSEAGEYLRGNLFTNTPDILPRILQKGGRPAFKLRLVLAATLSSVYGIYNGFELCEARAIPGTEEYANSEKYEYKVWDWDRPGNIKDVIARINRIRKDNPALHRSRNLRFYHADDDNVLFYGKATPGRENVVLVAANLDPFQRHRSTLHLPIRELGIGPNETYEVYELITETRYLWKGERQSIDLDPQVEPAAIFALERWPHKDYDTPCL